MGRPLTLPHGAPRKSSLLSSWAQFGPSSESTRHLLVPDSQDQGLCHQDFQDLNFQNQNTESREKGLSDRPTEELQVQK